MAKVILSAEGQEISVDDAIARDDSMLRQALVAYYPQLATAKIERVEKDGELRVTVSKQAGPKGAPRGRKAGSFLQVLVGAPEHVNPAVALVAELGAEGRDPDQLPLTDLLLLQDRVDATIQAAERERQYTRGVFDALKGAPAVPAREVPRGF